MGDLILQKRTTREKSATVVAVERLIGKENKQQQARYLAKAVNQQEEDEESEDQETNDDRSDTPRRKNPRNDPFVQDQAQEVGVQGNDDFISHDNFCIRP